MAALPEPRRAYATAVLGDLGGVLLFDTMADAIAFANDYAPEHLQVATVDPEITLRDARYAGEILLGQDTPIGASSYTIGIPATLPTGGFAKLNGGVTARTFQTTTSIARLAPEALAGLAGPTTRWPITRASRRTPTPSGAAASADARVRTAGLVPPDPGQSSRRTTGKRSSSTATRKPARTQNAVVAALVASGRALASG